MKNKDIVIIGEDEDIITPLTQNKKVQCLECRNGIYRPLRGSAEKSHYFVCDNCGAHIHFDPILDV